MGKKEREMLVDFVEWTDKLLNQVKAKKVFINDGIRAKYLVKVIEFLEKENNQLLTDSIGEVVESLRKCN